MIFYIVCRSGDGRIGLLVLPAVCVLNVFYFSDQSAVDGPGVGGLINKKPATASFKNQGKPRAFFRRMIVAALVFSYVLTILYMIEEEEYTSRLQSRLLQNNGGPGGAGSVPHH
jgi:hypothetical protein